MQCDGNRNYKPIMHESKYCGAGESPRRSVDFLKNTKHTCEHQREISSVRIFLFYSYKNRIKYKEQWKKNLKSRRKKCICAKAILYA